MTGIVVACVLVLTLVGVYFYRQYAAAVSSLQRRQGQADLPDCLAGLDDTEVAAVLAKKVEDMSPALLQETAQFLTSQGRAHGILSLMDHSYSEVRSQVAELLGYIPLPGRAGALVTALGDKSEAVCLAAGASLIRIQDPSTAVPLAEALSAPGRLLPARVADVLVALGETAVRPLIDELKYAGSEGQPLICQVLGQIGDSRAVPALRDILRESPYKESRAAAAESLGSIPGEGNEEALIEALNDPDWEVRAKAAQALGELGGQEAIAGLTEAQKDENWSVRAIAEAALKKLSPGSAGAPS